MDISTIKWQRGVFQTFQAVMKIRMGGNEPLDIQEGDEIEYDGTILKYAGAEINTPQLRGAFRSKWFTVVGDGPTHRIQSIQPSRNVAKAQSVNRDLNNVSRAGTGGIQTSSLDEQTVLDVSDRRGSGHNALPNVLQSHPGRMSIAGSGSEDGVVIGTVRTPAKIKVNDTTQVSAQQIQALEERTLGQPVFNENARRQVQKEGVTIRTPAPVRGTVVADEDDGVEVAQVRRAARPRSEGLTIEDTSNIRSQKAAAKKPAAPAAPKLDQSLPPKIRIARAIDPSFPAEWSFTGKLADRLAAVKKHGASKHFINALYAAEGDQMRAQLEKHYAKYL